VSVLYGGLDDLDVLRCGAAAADATIHLAFDHDFTDFMANCAKDTRAIEAIGAAVSGTSKPLIVAAGAALIAPGRVLTEADIPGDDFPLPRRSELTARALAKNGIRTSTVRIGLAHGCGDHGFLSFLVSHAKQTGVSAYVGEGQNRWPGVHRDDVARLYRLILEEGVTQPVYHAVAEEGIPFREIAQTIGTGLGLPVESRGVEHFDWFGAFASIDMPQSSAATRKVTGWQPRGIGLLEDLNQAGYFDCLPLSQ
jgi:nucleoside-diphosphate-sugar epimerase